MAKNKAGQRKPGQQDPGVAEKWAKALALRTAGKTYQEIAVEVGYADRSSAYNAVMDALKAMVREPADQARELELERLDKLTAAVWERAMKGDDFAIDRALKIADRRARLLGLDAPQKLELAEMKEYGVENDPEGM